MDKRKFNKGTLGNKGGRKSKSEEQKLCEKLSPLEDKAFNNLEKACIFFRVSLLILGLSFNAFETVETETPSSSAMLFIVVFDFIFKLILSYFFYLNLDNNIRDKPRYTNLI